MKKLLKIVLRLMEYLLLSFVFMAVIGILCGALGLPSEIMLVGFVVSVPVLRHLWNKKKEKQEHKSSIYDSGSPYSDTVTTADDLDIPLSSARNDSESDSKSSSRYTGNDRDSSYSPASKDAKTQPLFHKNKEDADSLESKLEKLRQQCREEQEKLDKIVKRTEKLKPLANSILRAYKLLETDEKGAIEILEDLELEKLLPERDLNCLTIKELRSQYNNLRKQIVTVCQDNEKRYTTKSNAALYRLMVLALEAELDSILYKLQYGKKEEAYTQVKELTWKYYTIANDGNQNIAGSLKRFICQIEELYRQVIDVEYAYYVRKERAKEEQRALRDQMRQEAEERKQLELEKKKIEKEEEKYKLEIERVQAEMADDLEAMQKRVAELQALLAQVETKKNDITNLQNGKAGTVYIISNIGSFGENVFKIGMTRRLDPQDRVDELGNASVPFPFDVHSFIFSEDAPALEAKLHKRFHDRRVNKVNLRKEFFNITIEELQKTVEEIDPTASFRVTALAEQYQQSLSIDTVPEESLTESEDEE